MHTPQCNTTKTSISQQVLTYWNSTLLSASGQSSFHQSTCCSDIYCSLAQDYASQSPPLNCGQPYRPGDGPMDVQPLPRGKEKMSTHLGAGTPGKTSHQPPSARSGGEPLLQIARSSLPDLHLAVQLPDRQVAAVGAEGTLLHPLH